MRRLAPEKCYWCPSCGAEGVEPTCDPARHGGEERARADLGWRVGNGRHDYSYYSTYESAMKDRRVG